MITINTILYYTVYAFITGYLIIPLLATIISYIKQLRDWAREERAKEQRQIES